MQLGQISLHFAATISSRPWTNSKLRMPLAAAAAAVAACPSPIVLTRPLFRIDAHPGRRRRFRLEASSSASASASASAPAAADEGGGAGPCPVVRFDMADFTVADRVNVGLHGWSDEIIFEATVCDPSSELYGSTVVLRQLKSLQAKRRGRRALEVLKKLARRQMMYHCYALQFHGYIAPCNAVEEEDVPLVLVHGYHGSHSLCHWLQLSDWLPTLEATLALDEEQVRRVGDDSVGGAAVTRQLRLIRILMRDLLIGVNYLHSHGLAHTELRLENVHVSPMDKHVKVVLYGHHQCPIDGAHCEFAGVHGIVVEASSCCFYDCNCKDQAQGGCSDWVEVPGAAWKWNDATDKVSREPGDKWTSDSESFNHAGDVCAALDDSIGSIRLW